MLYLVCRADQLPQEIILDRAMKFSGNTSYYPRIVFADSEEDAIDRAFSPEKYEPGGARNLVVIELGEIHEFVAKPVRNYELQKKQRQSVLNLF